MKPAIYNLEIEQGARYERILKVIQGLESIDGYTARLQIRQNPGGKIFWDSNNLQPGDEFVVDEGEKSFHIKLAPATTAKFKFSTAYFDLDVNEDRWIKGRVILNKEITRG